MLPSDVMTKLDDQDRKFVEERVAEALVEINRCPECGGRLRQANHGPKELVCSQCGRVVENFSPPQLIPMNETRSPTFPLAMDKSLGTVIPKRVLFKVLARDTPPKNIQCPKCGYILKHKAGVVPATQIKSVIEVNKHPIIQHMDKYGSQLMDRWVNRVLGRDSPLSRAFANELSSEINKIGEKLKNINDGRKAKRYTEVAFLKTWMKMKLPKIDALRWGLWPEKGGVPEIRELALL